MLIINSRLQVWHSVHCSHRFRAVQAVADASLKSWYHLFFFSNLIIDFALEFILP